ncbi:hypothetical protein BRM3_02905 [Brachybacterium huguangmaarense]|uniref:Lipoprotein n=1 Tax=Brachybacterium huguangmaarense TaxID=1652028 RepID=A0ABY6G2G9_9MICO|nr:hypothetical protein [Brachybacterium huguangmaarense]UYG17399.1 hypothetical protein BRM3_02905 [Brachybacterium huguangmaarense]
MSAVPALDRRRALSRGRHAVWPAALALVVAVALPACEPSPTTDTPSPTTAPAADAPRDVLADLDRSVWSATDTTSLLALDIDSSAVDTAAWDADGIDSKAIEATRSALADYLSTAMFDPDALRETDDADDEQAIIDAAPTVWKDKLKEQWSADNRRFYAIEFAEPYRVIGAPRGALTWRLAELDDGHTLTLGGTVAYSVIDTRTGDTGAFAVRVGIVATPAAEGADTPSKASIRVTLNGQDICQTDAGDGTIVPAIGTADDAQAAQKAVMDSVIASPDVSADALAHDDSDELSGDVSTAVVCD